MNTPDWPSAPDTLSVQQFLYHEARLLDEQRLEEWLELFAEEGHYWVPATWGQTDPLDHLSLYYEDRDLLKARIMRLRHPRTETMRPPPRTVHQVGNIEIERGGEEDRLTVRSTFIMVEYRLSAQRLFAGSYRHTLRWIRGEHRIVTKRVDLLNCDAEQGHVRLIVPF